MNTHIKLICHKKFGVSLRRSYKRPVKILLKSKIFLVLEIFHKNDTIQIIECSIYKEEDNLLFEKLNFTL